MSWPEVLTVMKTDFGEREHLPCLRYKYDENNYLVYKCVCGKEFQRIIEAGKHIRSLTEDEYNEHVVLGVLGR